MQQCGHKLCQSSGGTLRCAWKFEQGKQLQANRVTGHCHEHSNTSVYVPWEAFSVQDSAERLLPQPATLSLAHDALQMFIGTSAVACSLIVCTDSCQEDQGGALGGQIQQADWQAHQDSIARCVRRHPHVLGAWRQRRRRAAAPATIPAASERAVVSAAALLLKLLAWERCDFQHCWPADTWPAHAAAGRRCCWCWTAALLKTCTTL